MHEPPAPVRPPARAAICRRTVPQGTARLAVAGQISLHSSGHFLANGTAVDLGHIRNFCIIAHIDHGKTTISDRLLEATQTVAARSMQDQLLDSMDLERERGITIKSHPVSLRYRHPELGDFLLNLMDTPGHVDFSYEVSRSLAACEGAVLLVDAAQGIEAQTVANAHLAVGQGLQIVPVINKVDLPNADVPGVRRQLEEILAIPGDEAILASGKTGVGIEDLLDAIVRRIPAPTDCGKAKALIFDSVFDSFRGVICHVRLFGGTLRPGQEILLMHADRRTQIKELGRFTPAMTSTGELSSGQVGYLVTSIRSTAEVQIGDTVTSAAMPADEPLRGYREVRPMVFSGIYPLDTADFEKLKASMGRLRLNDSALTFTPESSIALGFGFRCGFLGLLHMEIVQERIRREYNLDLIATYPGVLYHVLRTDGSVQEIDNPQFWPDPSRIAAIEEPTILATIHSPASALGDVLALVNEKRGICTRTETVDAQRLMLSCQLPLNEILIDFNDRLKSVTRGYGSLDYEPAGYQKADLVKLDILVNGEAVDAFSSIAHRSKAVATGRRLCEKLKNLLPRQLFKIAIQAAIGGDVVARETIGALRKDVTAKCYGGDVTRKRKLLEKQKEGKKRMKTIGKVAIPQDAFIKLLRQ
ncbi:MAG: translation elongation factor 4 [Puniceicoccales bacterium]|jgi:GTP-binding protein LepA|nr:translation elongation factor 4 [Puniceicoccales bacterium]